MRIARVLLPAVFVSAMTGCSDEPTEPLDEDAPCPISTAGGIAIRLPIAWATGVDDGPQDGVFDSMTTQNLGSVNDNGYTSYRTAFEFSLSDLAAVSAGNASLVLVVSAWEGVRSLELHGYSGDGTVQLEDFALDALVGSAIVDSRGVQTVAFDVSAILAEVLAGGGSWIGFNVREAPANTGNYTVMYLDLGDYPRLTIETVTAQSVHIDVKPDDAVNIINASSQGKIPVALLSEAAFDAVALTDPSTLTFGKTGDEASLAFCNPKGADLNRDGLRDLLCHFHTRNTGFVAGDTRGVLKGRTRGGEWITGTDDVQVVK